ncbi:MAG: C10 family peptidase [Bacteroidales bacterium]
MKQRLYFLLTVSYLSAFSGFSAIARLVDYQQAKTAASNKLISLQKSEWFNINDHENRFIDSGGNSLFYIFELNPAGYMAVSADNDLPPVIAYSFTNGAGVLDNEANTLIRMLKADLTLRLHNIHNLPPNIIEDRRNDWEALLASNSYKKPLQQWPPEGSTATGGWIETNWTQDGIYDDMCPMDPITNQRSFAGCPATAMAQILNYYKTTNGTQFTDEDDYYHQYAGRNYWIDNDYAARDFPSFPELNAHLDTVNSCYAGNGVLKNPGKAALTFACGVAAHQVYSSQGSGTFGVSQAVDSYLRFGFSEITFLENTNLTLYDALSLNMKDARPAHLAIVDPGWTTGHNVVVDGYNTDDYFHLNFGWGGAYNGWYLLPDEIPYGLTVIEGLIADIAFPPTHTGISNSLPENQDLQFSIYPNPTTDRLTVAFTANKATTLKIDIYDLMGTLLISIPGKQVGAGSNTETIGIPEKEIPKLEKGLYLCKLRTDEKVITRSFIVQ